MDRTTAAEYVKALRANTDDMYADRVTMDEFRARNRAIWSAIELRPRTKSRVLAILRGAA